VAGGRPLSLTPRALRRKAATTEPKDEERMQRKQRGGGGPALTRGSVERVKAIESVRATAASDLLQPTPDGRVRPLTPSAFPSPGFRARSKTCSAPTGFADHKTGRSQDGPITRRLRGSTSQSETRLIRDMGPEGLIDRGRPPVQEIRATTVAVPKSSPAVKTEVCKVASSAPAAAAVRSAWTPLTTTS